MPEAPPPGPAGRPAQQSGRRAGPGPPEEGSGSGSGGGGRPDRGAPLSLSPVPVPARAAAGGRGIGGGRGQAHDVPPMCRRWDVGVCGTPASVILDYSTMHSYYSYRTS